MTPRHQILVVDDDDAIRTVLSAALRRAGHDVRGAGSLAGLRDALAAGIPDLLITDVVLPDGDGLDEVPKLAADHPHLPIIVLSARNTLSTAVRATGAGAFDYLPKPFDLDELAAVVARALERRDAEQPEVEAPLEDSVPLIGRSPAMQDVYRIIARVVSNDLTILVSGESGTGKELVARAIHDLGHRRSGPFVALNMAAIPRELIEAELFGHERGAFTGAQARMAGKFEQASGGTLFLDEIGDMPMEAQTRLLRVLQSGEFTTVGGSRSIRADVRIIAATNRDLGALVTENRFREDLFYRLNVVPVALPALRERRQDIGLLARHFLDAAAEEGLPKKRLDADSVAVLERFNWPGNVRELENLMRRLAVLVRDERIGPSDIRDALGETASQAVLDPASQGLDSVVRGRLRELVRADPDLFSRGTLYRQLVAEVERPLIRAMLERFDNNQLRTAQALGINRNTLRHKMRILEIED